MNKAIEVAKWFMNKNEDISDSLTGNMKLNKLLYFSQLISLVKNKKPLFQDDLYAFKNGVVVENVRQEYKANYTQLKRESRNYKNNFNCKDEDVIKITNDIFGSVDAEELSRLTHEHSCWKDYFSKSKDEDVQGYYHTDESIISINRILNNYKCDLDLIENILSAYEEDDDYSEDFIEVNNVKYYYNPNEISLDKETMNILKNFPANENAYSLCIDETQGLIIY